MSFVPTSPSITVDVVIVGGGIAGLWTLHQLRKKGLSVVLLEKDEIGGGQSNKAQGIIHGGMKYALAGKITNEVTEMSDIPAIWKACLKGNGPVDLSNVPILSEKQYLWSPHKFKAKLAKLFASMTLKSGVMPLTLNDYPTIFHHPAFKGEIFALDELVIDVPILLQILTKSVEQYIFKIEELTSEDFSFKENGYLKSIKITSKEKVLHIQAQSFIFTAGAGNEPIMRKTQITQLKMQRRPLHMVMVKTSTQHTIYAHCVGLGPKPRITITTHQRKDGALVWYLGGLLAEEGVMRDKHAQILATQKELRNLFPWISFAQAEFATFMIDRAEPEQSNGLKPDSSFFKNIHNIIIAWPTKLAFAPKLAYEIDAHLQKIIPSAISSDMNQIHNWPKPTIAEPIWEDAF